MTGSRVNFKYPVARAGFAVALIVAFTASSTVPAAETQPRWRLGQIGPPVMLAPGIREERPPPPDPGVRNQDAADEPARAAEPALPPIIDSGAVSSRVEVDSLTELDPDSVGLLDESQGGFGVDLWNGTDRAMVERLLPRLPAATGSRIARQLMKRLLLSRATVPQGTSSGKSLLALRVGRLLAMGDIKSAVRLLRAAPSELADEASLRAEVEGMFFAYDNPGACGKVRSLIRRHKGQYWQQANAFCLALAGQHAKTAMIADILRERESDVGPAFFALVDALAGDKDAKVDSLPNPQGLQLSMMRVASLRLPSDTAQSRHPAVLRAVAFSPNAEFDVRLEAAERAMMMGALSSAELLELYGGAKFSSKQRANPVTAAAAIWGPRGRALLLLDADGKNTPTAKAEALRQAWSLSQEKGGRVTMMRASLPVLLAIEPASQLIWFARDAALALFSAGEISRAMAWFSLAQQESEASDEARSAAIELWPLAVLADVEDTLEWDPGRLDPWWEKVNSNAGPEARVRALTLFSIFEALGRPVGQERWLALIGDAKPVKTDIPDAAVWHSLRHASEATRLGETVLLALLALGEGGDGTAGGANPLTVTAVIVALRRVGLEKEARELALETAVRAGV